LVGKIKERYCDHRKLSETERLSLFPLFISEGAADWMMTVPVSVPENYKFLKKAFRDYYMGPEELKWKGKGALWS